MVPKFGSHRYQRPGLASGAGGGEQAIEDMDGMELQNRPERTFTSRGSKRLSVRWMEPRWESPQGAGRFAAEGSHPIRFEHTGKPEE